MLFLLTCENQDADFIETLIETSKIVTIRLAFHREEYNLVVEDVNDTRYVARFNTEVGLRNRLKELLTFMNADVSLADTMKIPVKKDKSHQDLMDKLSEIINKL